MKNSMRTYLRGSVSQQQQADFQAHMDRLGFGSTSAPGEFEASGKKYAAVTAARDVLSRSSQLPMHSHTFMEIFQYVSDSRVEYLIGTNRYILRKGDIVCVPPGTCHQVLRYEPEDVPCVRNLIAVTPGFLETMGWSWQPGQYFLVRVSQDQQDPWLQMCRLCVEECKEKPPLWRSAVTGYAQVILTQILRNADASIKAEKAGIFEELLNYVDTHLSRKITLTETAQHFYISDRTVNREFQKNLGVSFYRYVTQRRLLMARNLIFSDIPLEEVCRRVGFADYPTFYRAFKKEYGLSPRQMRSGE